LEQEKFRLNFSVQEKLCLILIFYFILMTSQTLSDSVLVPTEQKGIYSLDGKLDFDVPGRLIVAVHPYFFYPPELPLGYLDKIEKVFANYQGPVLTLEEGDTKKWQLTTQHIGDLAKKGERYFVKTEPLDPSPSEFNDFSPLISFIQRFNKDVCLMGRQVFNMGFWSRCGCLGYFKHILESNSIQADYIPGCTF
jgi:hypothetical protein